MFERFIIFNHVSYVSMIYKKIESFFRLYPIYHLTAIHIAGVGPSRIDDTKIHYVEVPTLNASTGMAQGSAKALE